MMKITPITPQSDRYRRIGRKTLKADRLARALGIPKPVEQSPAFHIPVLSKKRLMTVAAVVLIVLAGGFFGIRSYSEQVAKAQATEAIQQQASVKAKSEAADACRREKAAQKADKIGTLTYDQLYDYDDCDQ